MPNIEIQDLPPKDPPELADKLEIQEDGGGLGSSKYITIQALANFLVSTSGVQTVVAGTNVVVDNTDPANPIVSVPQSNLGVLSVGAGTNVNITGGAQNPIVNVTGVVTSVTDGDSVTVDNADLTQPIVSLDTNIWPGFSGFRTIGSTATGDLSIGQSGSGDVSVGEAKGGQVRIGDDSTALVSIGDGKTGGNITIGTATTVPINIRGLLWPTGDGANGQVLTTNGAGVLSFTTPASAGQVDSVVAGANISVDNADPVNPVVALTDTITLNNNAETFFESIRSGAGAVTMDARSDDGGFRISRAGPIMSLGFVDSAGLTGDVVLAAVDNAGVQLRFDDNTVLQTVNGGIDINGRITTNADVSFQYIANKTNAGSFNQMQFNNIADAVGVSIGLAANQGFIAAQRNAVGTFQGNWITSDRGGGVQLYFNNVLAAQTTDTGGAGIIDERRLICRGRIYRRKTSTQNIDQATPEVLTWDSTIYNTLSATTNATTVTVPAAISFARLTFVVTWGGGGTLGRTVFAFGQANGKNNQDLGAVTSQQNATGTPVRQNCSGIIIPVTPGDLISIQGGHNDTTDTIRAVIAAAMMIEFY